MSREKDFWSHLGIEIGTVRTECHAVADPGEGPGPPAPPPLLLLDQTEARRAETIFFGNRSPPSPPPPSSQCLDPALPCTNEILQNRFRYIRKK